MKLIGRIGFAGAVLLLAAWSLLPVIWTAITSISKVKDLTALPPNIFPDAPNFGSYGKLFGFDQNSWDVWATMRETSLNSLIGSVGGMIVVIFLALLSGYAFARVRFPGRNWVFFICIATMALPGYAVMIPLYQLMMDMHLLNTYPGIILVFCSAFAPIAVWLMRGFIAGLPYEIEESATIDGAGRWRILFAIVFPLTAPGLVAVAIITFLGCWSMFVTVMVFSPSLKTLNVFISEFVLKTSIDYPMMCAVGVISMIPPILIVTFLNRYLISGLMMGSVKS
ncbi:carbohydrate ABC transporter permease [Cohnella caldifontis]|uniref:carbohydrate ABC transporter permease n=1 Tax=Cohnella caldifontis TaxID=3027471 RepID=UPI0023EB5D74|nr:carbohydrate ABC transporter permease [Cohnella sp. YIM B05605]